MTGGSAGRKRRQRVSENVQLRGPLTQLQGLRLLAGGFNQLREEDPLMDPRFVPQKWVEYTRMDRQAWADVEAAITSRGGRVGGFNALAAKRPMVLQVGPAGPQTRWVTRLDQVLWLVWRYYFHDRGWERLKRCLGCHRWLVDETRNKNKQFCSRACHDRHWSRAQRRASGHRQ